jgi:transaldolase
VRNPIHVLDAALAGADIATMPINVVKSLANHPLTDKGIQLFLKDWEKVPKQNV